MSTEQNLDGKFALDEWTHIYPAPTGVPFELKTSGSVYRGMNDLDKAKEYATEVSAFFAKHSLDKQVFVVRGPTSTTKCKFEVVTATCGYTVVYRTPKLSPEAAAIHQRDVLLKALEGLLENQTKAWQVSGFTDDQIRAMPYLKPSFEAVQLATR